LIDVLHSLTATFRALKLGHATLVFTTEFGPTNHDVNDHFIDQVFYTANPTTVHILLRRWTKGDVDAFPR
jgi:hypothetical protein